MDSELLLTRIAELRDRINVIHQLAGPDLRKFLDTYDFPFSTMNALLAFGQRLLKDVICAKELVAKLCGPSETIPQQGTT
jgi:hypothetical protein